MRNKRNSKVDAPIVFECEPKQIAWNQTEVTENTRAYVGPLFKGIFKKLGHLEHLYTSFPESKIRRSTIEIGGKTAKQLEAELEKGGNKVNDYAKHMLNSKEFKSQKKSEQADLVRLKVMDLFNDNSAHTTDDIYKKAEKFGLELCPAEVGPHYRLQYTNQPVDEWFLIAMKQISGPGGYPGVFRLGRDAGGVWLYDGWAGPAGEWLPRFEVVFRLRK